MRIRPLALIPLAVLLAAPAGARAASPSTIEAVSRAPMSAPDFGRNMISSARGTSPSAILRTMLASEGIPSDAAAHLAARPTLAGALGRLLPAVATAEALRVRALRGLTPADAGTAFTSTPARTVVRGLNVARASAQWSFNAASRATWDRVDKRALADATTGLLAAIEDVTPALKAIGPGTRAASHCGATGDMTFETDSCNVMVGSSGPNGYGATVDPIVLIDLGGDDTYTGPTADAHTSVRVVLDVAGNDVYARHADKGVLSGQAAAETGVAVLADLSGNDSYSLDLATSTPEPGPPPIDATVYGQGGAATLGAAVLVDGAGDDTYSATLTSGGGNVHVIAQGAGELGIGALLDLTASGDTGNDARTASAVSTLHIVDKSPGFTHYAIGAAVTTAQGAGSSGAGVLTDGAGTDTNDALASGGQSTTTSQGGARSGAGIMVNASGNDTLGAHAIGDEELDISLAAPRGCHHASATVTPGTTDATAQGGALGGVAALVEGQGNGDRTIRAYSRAAALVEVSSGIDCSFFPPGESSAAHAETGGGVARGQGGIEGVAGVLVDLGGNDVNRLEATSLSRARAIATSPGPTVEVAESDAGPAAATGQGSGATGAGVLADASGNDEYHAATSQLTKKETSAGDVAIPNPGVQHITGWGNVGAGWLLELGGTDVYDGDIAQTAAANNSCWSNGPDGRGRDFEVTLPLPTGCP